MTLSFCLDDRGGLLFNGRRLSRDANLLADLSAAGPVTVDAFSEKLLASAGIPFLIAGEQIPSDARFFLENRDPDTLIPLADTVVIYRWNRHYPSDVRWEKNPADFGFTLSETSEFPGKSHETITKEVYVK